MGPRPSRADAGSARLNLASCARLRRARCWDNPSGWLGRGRTVASLGNQCPQRIHRPLSPDPDRVIDYIAKGTFTELLDGKIFHHQGIFAAQSAAGAQNLLREFPLPRLQLCKPFPVCHLWHYHSSFKAMVCPQGRMLPEFTPVAIGALRADQGQRPGVRFAEREGSLGARICESEASSLRFASLLLSLKNFDRATGTAPASRTAGPHHFLWRGGRGAPTLDRCAAKENRDPHRRYAVASRSLTPSLGARAQQDTSFNLEEEIMQTEPDFDRIVHSHEPHYFAAQARGFALIEEIQYYLDEAQSYAGRYKGYIDHETLDLVITGEYDAEYEDAMDDARDAARMVARSNGYHTLRALERTDEAARLVYEEHAKLSAQTR